MLNRKYSRLAFIHTPEGHRPLFELFKRVWHKTELLVDTGTHKQSAVTSNWPLLAFAIEKGKIESLDKCIEISEL